MGSWQGNDTNEAIETLSTLTSWGNPRRICITDRYQYWHPLKVPDKRIFVWEGKIPLTNERRKHFEVFLKILSKHQVNPGLNFKNNVSYSVNDPEPMLFCYLLRTCVKIREHFFWNRKLSRCAWTSKCCIDWFLRWQPEDKCVRHVVDSWNDGKNPFSISKAFGILVSDLTMGTY